MNAGKISPLLLRQVLLQLHQEGLDMARINGSGLIVFSLESCHKVIIIYSICCSGSNGLGLKCFHSFAEKTALLGFNQS